MQKINTLSNKNIAYIYFTVWAICVSIAFSHCNNKSNKSTILITGQLTNNNGEGIGGADVYILATEHDSNMLIEYPIAQCETEDSGFYQIVLDVNDACEYAIEARKKGFEHSGSTGVNTSENTNCINIEFNNK